MNIRELLRLDHGIEVRISAGTGHGSDPYAIEKCSADEAALTQVKVLRGIALGLGELWRIKEWKACGVDSSNEVIRIEAVRFTPTQIVTETRGIYFDTRAVSGDPFSLYPLISWRGPPSSVDLPYELGWLHFDEVINNTPSGGTLDQTILYSGAGAKISVHVYLSSATDLAVAREAELKCGFKKGTEGVKPARLTSSFPISESQFPTKFSYRTVIPALPNAS